MYSPKIAEDLIPRIYRTAKARRMPMTRFINDILEWALDHLEKGGEFSERSARHEAGQR